MAGADVLMSQTLPAIIGMGVVSESTKTMFGKNGRRTSSRRSTRTARRTTARIGGKVVRTGKRGGKYVMKNGRKVYI